MAKNPKHSVAVVGLGYVGLCSAVVFADRGARVKGLEIDNARLRRISRGDPPIHEPALARLLKRTLKRGSLSLTSNYDEALRDSEMVFITVGTPSRPNGAIDLRFVKAAAASIGKSLRALDHSLVIVKSTVVPGTTDGTVKALLEKNSGKKAGTGFGLCVNPEFLREGSAIWDSLHQSTVLIGSSDAGSIELLRGFYSHLHLGGSHTLVTSATNAEFVKYAVNSYRAVTLSFLNTIANLCSSTRGGDIGSVSRGLVEIAKLDKRYSRAGIGFGGSCLTKDSRALIARAHELGEDAELLKAALRVNERQPDRTVELAERLGGSIRGKRVTLLGLSFKANSDDLRESRAMRIAEKLIQEGAVLTVYDPEAMTKARDVLGSRVRYASSAKASLEKAECCIVGTDWQEFRRLTARDYKRLMTTPLVVDGRRIYTPSSFARAGVAYARIGSSD
ncbi:MAG: UDP-glucose/GDP-mannose dehydrogenase family protein [Thaumarchaeota archaeon]|nr:UDP-glucose/GDP-mannose dehydrogenase family protein [Nitrososphaerota archaeon]